MSSIFACLNLQLNKSKLSQESISNLQQILHDAAVWGLAEDAEVFYYENDAILGVSVECSKDPLSLLEAGMTLGFCQRAFEDNVEEGILDSTWQSLQEADGAIIDSSR
jgi:hypothetical protein